MAKLKPLERFSAMRIVPLLLMSFVLVSASTVASPCRAATEIPDNKELAKRIHRVENGLPSIPMGEGEPALHLTLEKMMKLYRVPGLSVAVIDNYKIAWAKGYGVKSPGSTDPVTPRTLFQAGSVSKPVAAAATLRLVQLRRISLDQDVNASLKSWKVPENEFTQKEKVTLRRILSHKGGLSVDSFPGYAVGTPVPTLVQVLNGEPPANTPPVRVVLTPGTKWQYSGGGATIEQQLVIDVTGKSFPQFMRETVFDKIGMQDTTFEQPLPANRTARAASGVHGDGTLIAGNWHIYPEMAAAGLWTTPIDLAKFAIEIAQSKHGKSNLVLSESMVRQMLTPEADRLGPLVLSDESHSDRMGLGFFLGDETQAGLFGHIGGTEGFRTVLIMFADSGRGAVIMANIDFGWPFPVTDFLVNSIAKEYGWNYARSMPSTDLALWTTAQLRGTPAATQKYQSFKKNHSPRFVLDQNTLVTLATGLYRINQLEDAIRVLKLETEEYPDYHKGYKDLADLYQLTGKRELALHIYQMLLERDPKNQDAAEQVEKLKNQH
jgi:CubicO group peptidase (beta-lactamase class C family)